MNKIKLLAVTAGILALGWGGIVVGAMNNDTIEVQDKIINVDPAEVVPEATPEPAPAVIEIESISPSPSTEETPVVEETDTIQEEADCPAPVDGSLNAQVEALKACYRAE